MDEFSINRLASMLDVDRATLLRALKDTPADAGSEPKPLFRVSRAVKALDHHRGKLDRRRKSDNGGGAVTVDQQRMFVMFVRLDDLHGKIEGAETVEERRRLMREEFFPLLPATTTAMREDSKQSGEDERYGGLRIHEHERMQLVTLRHCCGWNSDEVLHEFNVATWPDYAHEVDA
jgi:hypothetical protein